MKRSIMIFITLFSLSLPLGASGADDAGSFLKGKLDAVIAVLQAEKIDSQEKKAQAIGIIMPVFDMQLIAKLAVGQKFWPGFSDDQKARFTQAFTARLQKLYMGKIMQYTDEKILYQAPVQKDNKVHIPTELIANGSKYAILYKMYRSENDWKIYDIELDRVSILQSFRAQTNQALTTGTFEDLIRKLETPIVDN